jgi:hypothetical protein
LSDPARSLVLLKPTGAVPHKGGTRFETSSLEYKIVSEWIAAGAPPPKADDARITGLEASPDQVALKPGDNQELTVKAKFSDGSVRDVTRWVKYTDANATVTTVDDQGKVTVMGFLEGPSPGDTGQDRHRHRHGAVHRQSVVRPLHEGPATELHR